MISTQEEWQQIGTGAWLGGAEEKRLFETNFAHKKKLSAKPIFLI